MKKIDRTILGAGALRRSRRSKPSSECVGKPRLVSVSCPGDVSAGPNQDGGGSSDRFDYRKLPCAIVFHVDALNAVAHGRGQSRRAHLDRGAAPAHRLGSYNFRLIAWAFSRNGTMTRERCSDDSSFLIDKRYRFLLFDSSEREPVARSRQLLMRSHACSCPIAIETGSFSFGRG
jgi:hypothetical protein